MTENTSGADTSYEQALKSTGIVGGAQFLTILITVVKTKIVALLLGPAGVGVLGLLQGIVDMIRNATGLGIHFSAVKDVAAANASRDGQRIGRTIRILRRWVWGTGLLGMTVAIALSIPLSRFSFGNAEYAVPIVLVSVVLLFVWPIIFGALVSVGEAIIGMDGIGAGIYAFLNRLLIPTGLHHALNNVFWFDTIGLGDLSHYWAGDVSGQNGVTWSLGMYMSGFFPCMMFGVFGAALAMIKTAKNKKAAIGLVLSAAICAFVCGVTEPFEFGFMFLCFPLYIVYSALYGIFTIITYYSGFRAGFCFSAGATDLVFSASLPAAAKTWMIIPLGIAAFIVFYLVFYFAITKFDLKTPGREDEDAEEAEKKITLANNNYTEVASGVLKAIGGKANVSSVDYCATRLRFTIKDYTQVDEKAVKAAGAAGVIRPDKNTCQVIIGTKVQFVYDELKKML